MSQRKVITGAGGKPKAPPNPTQTPDNLRSEDTVEMVLGITEGPWKGLTNGDKSLYVGDTVLERQDGGRNFEEVETTVYPGTAFPDSLRFKLGGESSNTQVGVATSFGIPLTRQTEHGNIDAIDIRMVVNQLFKSVEAGKNPGVFDHTFSFKIKYKPLSATEWAEWAETPYMGSTTNPHVSDWDSSWSVDSYYDDGYWYDPQDLSRSWTSGLLGWVAAIQWARDQRAAQPGAPVSSPALNIKGKTTSPYVKEYRIPVQRIPEPYLIQIERLTADSSLAGDPRYYAEVTWESFQTIDTTPKKYPYTGFLQFKAKSTDQFTSVPQISGEGDGMLVKVPVNFDPETREYTGIWNGEWKEAWTNSPVWLLYEAIHNDRWGWSAYTPVSWSRYEAYALAQITDHILPSGKPRYTFNAYLTEPMDGREFCRYMAGSFNSVIVDDDNGHVRVLMDKDDPAVAIFGPESIVGDFEYTYTDVNTRYNDLTVVFRNPDIDYNEDRRGIKSDPAIAQHGRIPFDFVAVGTTDANEAVRKASRRLVSATTETEMVNFRTNRKAQVLTPYDIILITDPYKGYGVSGRFKSFVGSTVTLRDPIYLETGVTYGLEIESSEGILTRTVTPGTTGFTSSLTLNSALPSTVYQKAQFSLTQDGGPYGLPKPYRILDIKVDEDPDSWSIMAIEVNRLKFIAEDDATVVGEPRYSFPIKKEPEAPDNLTIINLSRAAPDGTMIYEARVDFTPPADPYVTNYFIRYRLEGEIEYKFEETDGTGLVVSLPREGTWEFQAQSRNVWQQQSPWISTASPVIIGKSVSIAGGSISSVTGGLNQITVKVTYPSQTDIRYARIYESTSNNNASATYVGRTDSDTFVRTGLVGVVNRFYWVKFEDNLENIGPFTATGGVMGTTTQITAPDIGAGTITLEKFATGVAPVEIVSSLPATGNFVGRTVVLTTDGKLYHWDGTMWVRSAPDQVGAGVETVAVLPSTGNYEGRMAYLTTDDKLYRYTGSAWTAAIATVDLTGTISSAQIAANAVDITKFASTIKPIEIVATLPVSGNTAGRTVFLTTDSKLYRYNGTAFVASVPTTDLTGTITGAQIAANAVDITKFASGLTGIEVVGTLPVSGNTAGRTVFLTTDSKLYRYNGTAFVASVPTTDLTGTISNAQIAANAVDITKFASTIKPIEIVATLPTTGNTAGRTVFLTTDSKLYRYNGTAFVASVPTTDLTGTITGAQIDAAAIDATKFASTIKPVEIVATLPVSGNTAGRVVFLTTDSKLYRYNGSAFVKHVDGADITANSITAGQIQAGAITATEIATDAITAVKIASNAITSVKIAAGAITAGKIAADAVTATEIAANSITASELAANSVVAGKIAASAVTATQLAAESVTASKLFIGDTSNIFPDPQLAEEAQTVLSSTLPNAATLPYISRYSRKHENSNSRYSQYFPVEAGKPLYVSIIADFDPGETASLICQLYWYDSNQNGLVPTSTLVVSVTAANGPGKYGAIVTAPADAAYSRMRTAAGAGLVSAIYTSSPVIRRAADGELIVNGAITAGKIAADTITANEIAANAITSNELSANSVIAGKIAAGVITATEIATDAITAIKIAAGAITAVKIAANTITANEIAANAITSSELSALSVIAGKIAAGAVTATELAANSVIAGKIAAGIITATEIATGAITTAKIAALAVTAAEIAAGTITAAKIAANTITAGQIAALTITSAELAANSVIAGKIAAGAVTAGTIVAGSITGDRLVANTITAGQIAAGTITTTQIAAATIVASNVAVGTLTGDRLAANTITASKIAAGTITAVEIATNAITSIKIAASAITSDKIDTGAITAAKIAAGAITADMIGAGTITVSVSVGSTGKIVLDGANNRILISD